MHDLSKAVLIFGALTAGPTVVLGEEFRFIAQYCTTPNEIIAQAAGNNELPLFTAQGFQLNASSGQMQGGAVMFWTNQSTGTWTMAVALPDGSACEIAFGNEFAPYTAD